MNQEMLENKGNIQEVKKEVINQPDILNPEDYLAKWEKERKEERMCSQVWGI